MKKFLMLSAALLISTAAQAADMNVLKAPSFNQPYPTSGCGAYYGINVLGSAQPIKDATVGATAIGGDVGGLIGYACQSSPSTFWFGEVIADVQNLNGDANGLAFGGPAHIEERVGFGGPLNSVFGTIFPNLNFPAVPAIPTLPNNITSGPQNGYLYAALNEDDISAQFGLSSAHSWLITPEVGVGMQSRLSNQVVADAWAGARIESNALCLGVIGGCPRFGTGFVTGLAFKY